MPILPGGRRGEAPLYPAALLARSPRAYLRLIGAPGLGYDAGPSPAAEEDPTLARAKNTDRAEARRRYRATLAAEAARAAEAEGEDVDGADDAEQDTAAASAPRTLSIAPSIRWPDIRADLAALPSILLSKRLLWLVALAMVAALAVGLAAARGAVQDPALLTAAAFFVQTMLYPPALVPIFVAGFVSPRASYLVGLLFGLLDGILFTALAFSTPIPTGAGDVGATMVTYLLLATFSGAVIGGFAAWYRNFLQRTAQRRRAAEAVRTKQKRRDERKPSKSRYPAEPR